MTIYLVKCRVEADVESTSHRIPKIIKAESDVFGTEKEAQKFKQDFFKKHEKHTCLIYGRVIKKEI